MCDARGVLCAALHVQVRLYDEGSEYTSSQHDSQTVKQKRANWVRKLARQVLDGRAHAAGCCRYVPASDAISLADEACTLMIMGNHFTGSVDVALQTSQDCWLMHPICRRKRKAEGPSIVLNEDLDSTPFQWVGAWVGELPWQVLVLYDCK